MDKESPDLYEDVFAHDLAEIEWVWKNISLERAKNAEILTAQKDLSNEALRDLRSSILKHPIKLSEIRKVVQQELVSIHEYEAEDEQEKSEAPMDIEKEAGSILSHLGGMFIELLMIKTMYNLPIAKQYGVGPHSSKKRLKIDYEDIRRALLSEDTYDILVQSGYAQPESDYLAERPELAAEDDSSESESSSDNEEINQPAFEVPPFVMSSHLITQSQQNLPQTFQSASKSKSLHLGYWKTISRTCIRLEPKEPQTISKAHTKLSIMSKLGMDLNIELDPSHKRYTLWPMNDDLIFSHIEFRLLSFVKEAAVNHDAPTSSADKNSNFDDMAHISGRIQLGEILIPNFEGEVDLMSVQSSPINFQFQRQENSAAHPLLSVESSEHCGFGSFQFLDSEMALAEWPENKWLENFHWAVLSLDLNIELGDTGFYLHSHYLCAPLFAPISVHIAQSEVPDLEVRK